MHKKIFSLIIVVLTMTLMLTACSQPATPVAEEQTSPAISVLAPEQNVAEPADDQSIIVTDLLGREVEISAEVNRVVAIGPGALRLYVYAGNIDYIIGVEDMELSGDNSGKPYMLANSVLAELPSIGQGGPNNVPDPEKLLVAKPDVIFSTYGTTIAGIDLDELQAQTGIPVIALDYGKSPLFGKEVNQSLMLIGQVTGNTEKAESVIDYLMDAQEDLITRTQSLDNKPSVYVGALSFKGAHGIESTQGHYALLDSISAVNVVDETDTKGSIMIDKEQLLVWNPDYIFLDYGGLSLVQEDLLANPAYYQMLDAFKNGHVYSQLPYNSYSTNIGTALADTYFMGTVLYPDAFSDIDPVGKANEIYNALLGETLYDQVSSSYGGFTQLSFE